MLAERVESVAGAIGEPAKEAGHFIHDVGAALDQAGEVVDRHLPDPIVDVAHDRFERSDFRSRRTIGVACLKRRHVTDRVGQVPDLLAGDIGRERHVVLVDVQPVADAVEDRGEGIGILAAEPGGGVLQLGEQVAVDGIGADVAVGVVERQPAVGEGVGDGVRMDACRVGNDGPGACRKSRRGGEAAAQRVAAEDDVAAAGRVGAGGDVDRAVVERLVVAHRLGHVGVDVGQVAEIGALELQHRQRIGAVDRGIWDEEFGAESLVALRAVGTQVLLAEAVGFQLRGSGARPAFGNVVAGSDGAAERQHFAVVVERGQVFGLLPERAVALLLGLRIALGQQVALRGVGRGGVDPGLDLFGCLRRRRRRRRGDGLDYRLDGVLDVVEDVEGHGRAPAGCGCLLDTRRSPGMPLGLTLGSRRGMDCLAALEPLRCPLPAALRGRCSRQASSAATGACRSRAGRAWR